MARRGGVIAEFVKHEKAGPVRYLHEIAEKGQQHQHPQQQDIQPQRFVALTGKTEVHVETQADGHKDGLDDND